MSSKTVSDLDFALVCLKQLEPTKPDFEAVAQQIGCTKNQAYHRHYGMMKKFTAPAGGSPTAGTPAAAPKTPKKRAKKAKEDSVEDVEETIKSEGDNIDETPVKKKAKISTPKPAAKGKEQTPAKPKRAAKAKKGEPKAEEGAEDTNEVLAAAAVDALTNIVATTEQE